jgi:hypothetical protein
MKKLSTWQVSLSWLTEGGAGESRTPKALRLDRVQTGFHRQLDCRAKDGREHRDRTEHPKVPTG